MLASWKHQIARQVKQLIYGQRGEPYRVNGMDLRFEVGSRPIKLKYLTSSDRGARHDALQVKWLLDNLRRGDTAIDIGAHHGVYSLLMAALCGPDGQVIAFEPDPYARTVLERNLARNPGVRRPLVESIACSDHAGEAVLFSRGGNSQSSLARSAVEFAAEHHAESIRVPLTTLDRFLEERHLPEPRCVKIDPEGAEIRILAGATKLLRSQAQVLCELHPYAWPEFGNTFAEFKDLIAACGRRARYIDESEPIGAEAKYGTVVLESLTPSGVVG